MKRLSKKQQKQQRNKSLKARKKKGGTARHHDPEYGHKLVAAMKRITATKRVIQEGVKEYAD